MDFPLGSSKVSKVLMENAITVAVYNTTAKIITDVTPIQDTSVKYPIQLSEEAKEADDTWYAWT